MARLKLPIIALMEQQIQPPPVGCEGHLVAFYESDTLLVSTVADFLGDGLTASEAAIIVATQPHREAFLTALGERGVDVQAAQGSLRLVVLDARETLTSFMGAGGPDPTRFRQAISPVMDVARHGSRSLRVYGEMVALLWADGDVASAIALEDLWNELAAEHDFALLCAYPISTIEDPAESAGVAEICKRHTGVVAAGSDPIQMWEDRLTGLPNRRAFNDALQMARESENRVTLLLVDVDKLNEINGVHGRDGGDALLVDIAGAITRAVRHEDTVGRVGGDEFGVLLADYGDVGAAAAAERIRAAVQQRCAARGATVSIGGAGCESDRSATTLDADRALCEAKSHGGNTVSVWATAADVSEDRTPVRSRAW